MHTYNKTFYGKKSNNKSPNRRKKFTPQEDAKLKLLIDKIGSLDWLEISEQMPGRNPKQCRDRYINYLSDPPTNEPWKSEEDETILCLFPLIGPKWTEISRHIPGRSGNNVKNRWYKHLSKKYLYYKEKVAQPIFKNKKEKKEEADDGHKKNVDNKNLEPLSKQYSISALLI